MSILGAWHTRVRSFGSDSRCALVTARVRATEREFRRGLLAPGRIPQSSDVGRENGIGRLARISCSRPAALLHLMPIIFRFRVLESEPPTSELGGSECFANICAKSTDDVVSFLSQLCGSDWPATSVWIEVVITLGKPAALVARRASARPTPQDFCYICMHVCMYVCV